MYGAGRGPITPRKSEILDSRSPALRTHSRGWRLPERQRESPRQQRRAERIREGALADTDLLAAARADRAFNEACARALAALKTDDRATYTAALRSLVDELHHHVPEAGWDRADKLLASELAYKLEIADGRSPEEALATAMRFTAPRYPISADNPAEVVVRRPRTINQPLDLSRAQRAEVRRFQEDVLDKEVPPGRPAGTRYMTREEWYKRYREARDAMRSEDATPTGPTLAGRMYVPEGTFRRYKALFGEPLES